MEIERLTPKSKKVIEEATADINIFEGAVRSTKTITSRFAWLQFILTSPHYHFLQGGKSRTALLRNVLVPQMAIMDHFGIGYDYRGGKGYIEVEGNICWLVGCHNETAAEIIKGMTIGGADLDEADTYPQTVLDTILDRLSLEGARAYMTMNSNSPYHPIKTDLIDNTELIKAGKVYTSHWELYDNPFLPKGYIETMELRYPPGTLGHKRKIKGLWVTAEGAIYDRFVESLHTFRTPPFNSYDYYVIGTDEGLGNVTVFGLFGIKRTPYGNHYHLLDEVYWDVSQHQGRQLTPNELIMGDEAGHFKGALAMLQGRPLHSFVTSHDAAAIRSVLAKKDYQGSRVKVVTYTPKTLRDIYEIQKLIAEERFKISNVNCPNSVAQAQSYAWDPKAQARGEDRPMKTNDHCPDMWRGPIMATRGLTNSVTGYTRSKRSYKFSKKGRGNLDDRL